MREAGLRNLNNLARLQTAAPKDSSLLANGDRRVMMATGGDGDKPALVQVRVYIELFVTGIYAFLVRNHPHLNQMNVLFSAVVHLRMPDAGPRAHTLGQP